MTMPLAMRSARKARKAAVSRRRIGEVGRWWVSSLAVGDEEEEEVVRRGGVQARSRSW